ncbi:unnamed protein product [Symbiodinium microadriaticum]|nr:unnamed protein product [Symbiodinium microadriaticum]
MDVLSALRDVLHRRASSSMPYFPVLREPSYGELRTRVGAWMEEFRYLLVQTLQEEMNMLIQSFLHDCADPDRSGIHPEFIPFYFGKYFRRNFSPKFYGVNTMEELVALIDDTLILHGRCVETQISTEIDTNEVFVALTEDARRIRWRCGHSDHPLNPKPINPKP